MKNYDFYKVYYENEKQYIEDSLKYFKTVLDRFCDETGFDLDLIESDSSVDYISLVFELDDYLCKHHPNYAHVLYEIMSDMKFDMRTNIIGFLKEISFEGITELGEELKKSIDSCGCVDKIELKNGIITVHSELLGTFTSTEIKKYFEGDIATLNYLENSKVANRCHHVSFEMMGYLANASLLTYLYPLYFSGTYYHTVVRDEAGMIVDPANGIVMDESTRERLFGGTLVCSTRGVDLADCFFEAIAVADQKWKEVCTSPALTIAIYEQIKTMEMKKKH